ncbi:hypothetical protein MHYP_G00350650 [Metynnis hypsauchen]
MAGMVAANEASLAVIPPASVLACVITHRAEVSLCIAIDDVPFMISERFAPKVRHTQSVNLMGITIKSPPEIEEEVSRGCNARVACPSRANNAKRAVPGGVIKSFR